MSDQDNWWKDIRKRNWAEIVEERKLDDEQKSVESIINLVGGENFEKNIIKLNEIKNQLNSIKYSLEQQKFEEVATVIELSKNGFIDVKQNNAFGNIFVKLRKL